MRYPIIVSILLSGCVHVPTAAPVVPKSNPLDNKIVMKKVEAACVTSPPPALDPETQQFVLQTQISDDGSKAIFLVDMKKFAAFTDWYKANRIWTELTWDSCHLKP